MRCGTRVRQLRDAQCQARTERALVTRLTGRIAMRTAVRTNVGVTADTENPRGAGLVLERRARSQ